MEKKKNPAAVELGRLGGKKTSPAKLRACRMNAKKAGRKPGSKNKPKTPPAPK